MRTDCLVPIYVVPFVVVVISLPLVVDVDIHHRHVWQTQRRYWSVSKKKKKTFSLVQDDRVVHYYYCFYHFQYSSRRRYSVTDRIRSISQWECNYYFPCIVRRPEWVEDFL